MVPVTGVMFQMGSAIILSSVVTKLTTKDLSTVTVTGTMLVNKYANCCILHGTGTMLGNIYATFCMVPIPC